MQKNILTLNRLGIFTGSFKVSKTEMKKLHDLFLVINYLTGSTNND